MSTQSDGSTGSLDASSSAADVDELIDRILQAVADHHASFRRTPILHTPAEVGLDYEDITFASQDGVPLEAWYIPAAGSQKLIIANHPTSFSRSGIPAHLQPWKRSFDLSGNGFEVNLVPDYKILHDAGYNVLAYDMRSHGLSGQANGGIVSGGIFEARDVVGSLQFAAERPDTRGMTIGLFSRDLGANATFAAMTQTPAAFTDVKCLVASQPSTARRVIGSQLAFLGIPQDRIDDELMAELSRRLVLTTSIGLPQRAPQDWAKNVNVPTYLYQVHDDVLTHPSDVQGMYDNIPLTDKKLHWIRDTPRRFDGFLEFQLRPDPILEWFDSHMR